VKVKQWASPPKVPADRKLVGAWHQVGSEWDVVVRVPTVINGFGRTIETVDLPIQRRIERRPVWEFVGYEERTVES